MPIKRLKQKTMKKNKKTKNKKNTRKQKYKKSKPIVHLPIVHSNMDSMYNNSSMDSSMNSSMDSIMDSSMDSRNIQMQNRTMDQQKLLNLIAKISKERQNKTKSQTNLVAKIMKMPNSIPIISKPKTYAKTVSSYYSTVSRNGESHNKGKKIINESTNPYLEIDEMRDGQVKHYILPKNSITYREPIQEVLPRMNMQMQMQEPKILLEYYPHSRQNKKYKKKSKTHKK